MSTIANTAKRYSTMFTNCNLTKHDLQQAFENGARWMVEQRVDEKMIERIKERQKNDKVIVEVELSFAK